MNEHLNGCTAPAAPLRRPWAARTRSDHPPQLGSESLQEDLEDHSCPPQSRRTTWPQLSQRRRFLSPPATAAPGGPLPHVWLSSAGHFRCCGTDVSEAAPALPPRPQAVGPAPPAASADLRTNNRNLSRWARTVRRSRPRGARTGHLHIQVRLRHPQGHRPRIPRAHRPAVDGCRRHRLRLHSTYGRRHHRLCRSQGDSVAVTLGHRRARLPLALPIRPGCGFCAVQPPPRARCEGKPIGSMAAQGRAEAVALRRHAASGCVRSLPTVSSSLALATAMATMT
mmetsp:Transcript_105935/g.297875  ORF Transcript_105935/g.297875 Transcript_105935/m.297875 type:complete len:282 (-) Transcript_105935:508-1353(-)